MVFLKVNVFTSNDLINLDFLAKKQTKVLFCLKKALDKIVKMVIKIFFLFG